MKIFNKIVVDELEKTYFGESWVASSTRGTIDFFFILGVGRNLKKKYINIKTFKAEEKKDGKIFNHSPSLMGGGRLLDRLSR